MGDSSKSWYETFLSSLIILPNAQSPQRSVFYALKIFSIDYKELEQGDYALHFLFFDTTEKKFFGRHFKNKAIIKENRLEIEHKALFFHTSLTDDRTLIVCELVKLERNPWVVAWTVIPLVLQNQPITDYNSQFSTSIQPKKHRFYKGSCMCLMYLSDLSELDQKLRKVDGIIATLIQTNSSMNCAVSFMPEYFLTFFHERIPGLFYADGIVNPLDTFTGIIDNAVLSYSGNSQPEKRILDMLMQDYCLRMNQPVQKCESRKFEIIERRLKVGVHNGLCYVEEPYFLYLYEKEDPSGTFRKRSMSTGRNTESHSQEFLTRSCVRLIRLCADNMYAIVFSIDYLVGFRAKDNLINESQWLMIAWNAWSPFRNGSFTIADTITVPLVGGPRPNPDDIFCFKNLIKNEQKPIDDFFVDSGSHFNLKFNFAVVEATNSALLMLPQRQSDVTRATPLPNPDLPPLISPESFKNRDHDHRISEQIMEQNTSVIENGEIVPPRPSTHIVELEDNQNSMNLKRTRSVPAISTKSSVATEYVENFNESRISAFPRAISHYFIQFDFPPIFDSSDISPKFVDPSEKRHITTELETNSFFNTSEIVIQFMGIHIIPNYYFSAVEYHRSSYFFTLQFYRFGEITTERLLASSSTEWHSEKPMIFQRIDEDNIPIKVDGNGFTVRFTVNKLSIPPNDADDFAQYLIWDKLHIEVWNADSLIHIGTCSIPIQCLCRQNLNAVMTNVQCAIVQEGIAEGPVTSGLLFLKMANIGRPAVKNTQTDVKPFARLCHQNNSERFSLRARPLNAVHESALQRFLSTQKLDLCQRKEELFSNDSLRRVQQWNEIKKGTTTLNLSMKRFIFREELEAYKMLRSKNKATTLLRAVFKGITTHYTVYAKYGQVEFFEFFLRNTFADQVLCVVEICDPRLSVVLDMDEWKFYKNTFHLRTPIERDLFTVENDGKIMILLNGMESVCVPFKFDPQKTSNTTSCGNSLSMDSEIKAIFKRVDTDEPIGILEVLARNRNVLINKSFRSFCEESRKISRLFRLRGIRGNEQIFSCRCSNPTVLCSLRKCASSGQEVLISCNADYSPNVKTFLVMFYADKYFSRQLAVWKFSIHAMRRLDVQAIQAQLTKIPLPLGLSIERNSENLLQLYSSSEAVTFNPSKTFVSDTQLLCNVQALFVPNFAGKRLFVINMVDIRISRLLLSWIVHVSVCEPNIVKVYDVKVPLNADMIFSKKIELVNAYSIPRKFRVHTSNVRIVSAEEEYYSLPPNSSTYIQLNFHPISNCSTIKDNGSHTVQAFVYVENAEITEQEEAYSLRITFTND